MSTGARIALSPTLAIKEILFPTDFTTASEAALPYVRAIAERYGATVHVLHVLPPEPRLEVPLDQVPSGTDKVRHAAHQNMTRFRNAGHFAGLSTDYVLERGPMWDVVSSLVQGTPIDLVVLGTHGHHGLKKLVLGSVAEQIFRNATCPVLTVGPHVWPDGLTEGKLPRVLCATDFSPGSMRAVIYAMSLAREFQARLTHLHVIDEVSETMVEYLDQVTNTCRQRLRESLFGGDGLLSETRCVVEFGPAADTILKIAQEEQSDLVVLGARRSHLGAAATHMPWSTAYSVVCQAHCPVLTVRG